MTIAQTVGHITNENVRDLILPIISDKGIDEITKAIKQAVISKSESKRLLELAKRVVESAIERDERAALELIGEKAV